MKSRNAFHLQFICYLFFIWPGPARTQWAHLNASERRLRRCECKKKRKWKREIRKEEKKIWFTFAPSIVFGAASLSNVRMLRSVEYGVSADCDAIFTHQWQSRKVVEQICINHRVETSVHSPHSAATHKRTTAERRKKSIPKHARVDFQLLFFSVLFFGLF